MSRDKALDFSKGILIWLVVFGHSIQYITYPGNLRYFEDPIFSIIYIFHMPLFMALSGYFFNFKKSAAYFLGDFLQAKSRQILLPMLAWVLISVAAGTVYSLLKGHTSMSAIASSFLFLFFNNYWFLWAVFLSYVVTRVLLILPISISFSAPLLATILVCIPLRELPLIGFSLSMFSFTFPFFLLGSLAGHLASRKQTKISWVLSLLSGFILLISYVYWKPSYFAYINGMDFIENRADVVMTFVGGLSGSIFIISMLKILFITFSSYRIVSWFSSVGTITLEIYLSQTFVYILIGKVAPSSMLDIPYLSRLTISVFFSTVLILVMKIVIERSRPRGRFGILLWGR
jgi:fucose 4-O-acetylase-like acetyltransferase